MGLDFLRKTAKSYNKSLDKARAELARPDLFTRQPTAQPRTYSASTRSGAKLDVGEPVAVRLHDGELIAQRGRDVVATFQNPPSALLAAMDEARGEAPGTIESVFDITGTVEISIC